MHLCARLGETEEEIVVQVTTQEIHLLKMLGCDSNSQQVQLDSIMLPQIITEIRADIPLGANQELVTSIPFTETR